LIGLEPVNSKPFRQLALQQATYNSLKTRRGVVIPKVHFTLDSYFLFLKQIGDRREMRPCSHGSWK